MRGRPLRQVRQKLGMPAWLSVSVFGSIVVCLLGVWYLMKKVFIDFEYDEEVSEK